MYSSSSVKENSPLVKPGSRFQVMLSAPATASNAPSGAVEFNTLQPPAPRLQEVRSPPEILFTR